MTKRRALFTAWTIGVGALVWNCKSSNAPGTACKATSDCTAGYACVSGICAQLDPSDAKTCAVTADCQVGFECLNGKCGPFVIANDAAPTDSGIDSGADAGRTPCVTTLDPLPAQTIACPLGAADTCMIAASSGNACCVADGVGDCSGTAAACDASAPSAAVWACEKGTDCNVDNTYCCLTATGSIDTSACPARVTASASTCSHLACAAGQPQLCASSTDCLAVQTCTPIFVSFGSNSVDAGTVVGICTP